MTNVHYDYCSDKVFTDEQERAALEKVRDNLRDGTIPRHHASMSVTLCGSTACVGGHAAIEMGMRDKVVDDYVTSAYFRDDISALYYPPGNSNPGWSADSTGMADAIDRFLRGEEPWPT